MMQSHVLLGDVAFMTMACFDFVVVVQVLAADGNQQASHIVRGSGVIE
jgi:hypothetical protein